MQSLSAHFARGARTRIPPGQESCACCDGTGEHMAPPPGLSSVECRRCDAGGTVPEGSKAPFCPQSDRRPPRRRHWRQARGRHRAGDPVRQQRWYHSTSDEDIQVGDEVRPAAALGKQTRGGEGDENWVWLSTDPWRSGAYGHRTFEVTPHEAPKHTRGPADEYRASGATAVRELSSKEQREESEEYQRGARAYKSRTAMADDESYRISHRPMEIGAPIHNLTGHTPEDDDETVSWMAHDYLTHPQYYSDTGQARNPQDHEALSQMRRVQGRPDALVTIYRASHHETPARINHGDWVTLSKGYAHHMAWAESGDDEHGDIPERRWVVRRARVPAKHVRDAGSGGYREQGYWGPGIDSEEHTQVPWTRDAARLPAVTASADRPSWILAQAAPMLDLYHHTTPESARDIVQSGHFTADEDPDWTGDPRAYFSTHGRGGQAEEDYGSGGVVHVRIPEHEAELDDWTSGGERYYSVPVDRIRPSHIIGEAGVRKTALRMERVDHILSHYRPSDFGTWDEVRDNFNWGTPAMREFVEDVRRNGVKRPVPVDYELPDSPLVKNGHMRILAAERAGVAEVPVRQHEGFMDPDDPDPQGCHHSIEEHQQASPHWQREAASELPYLPPPDDDEINEHITQRHELDPENLRFGDARHWQHWHRFEHTRTNSTHQHDQPDSASRKYPNAYWPDEELTPDTWGYSGGHRTPPGHEDIPQTGEFIPLDQKYSALADHPGYGPEPERHYAPEDMPQDERIKHNDRIFDQHRVWKQHIKRGLSLGHLSTDQAKDYGYFFGGHETDRNNDPKWQPLPQHMYHVTTDLAGVREHGLKTRDELAQIHGGHGLGGGEDDTISVTTNRQLGGHILNALHEFHRVVNGRFTPKQMWEQAKRGYGADHPYHEDLAQYWQSGWKQGDEMPEGLRRAIEGTHRWYTAGTSQEEMDRHHPEYHARPAPDDKGWMSGHTPPQRMHAYWVRDMSPDERRENAADFYKHFAVHRQLAGGPEDPMFFATDTKAFAAKDPRNFALLHVQPRPGAQGYPLSGMHEWRTGTGDALHVTHFARQRGGQVHEAATDWNEHHSGIPGEIHRGLYAPQSHGVFAVPLSDEDIAHSLIRAHQEEHFPYRRDQDRLFGTHWTSDEGVARNFALEHETEHHDDDQCPDHEEHFEAAPVVFHAQRPERHEIETDPRRLGWQNVDDYDTAEQEVPIRHGAPVRITGVSWLKHTGLGPMWHRHNMREPVELRAEDRDSPDDPNRWNASLKQPQCADHPGEHAGGTDGLGHQVHFDPGDGWHHLDGSVGEEDGTSVDSRPVKEAALDRPRLYDKRPSLDDAHALVRRRIDRNPDLAYRSQDRYGLAPGERFADHYDLTPVVHESTSMATDLPYRTLHWGISINGRPAAYISSNYEGTRHRILPYGWGGPAYDPALHGEPQPSRTREQRQAALPPGLKNPMTGRQDWFHGTQARPEEVSQYGLHGADEFAHGQFEDPEGEGTDSGHWNAMLGPHFASSHKVAEEFARGEHTEGRPDEVEDEYGDRGHSEGVIHARLSLRNPKAYKSEHDMDHEAYEHEHAAGNHPWNHLKDYGPEGDEDSDYARQDMWPGAMGIRRVYGEEEIPREHYGDDHTGVRGHPMRTAWLNTHPDKYAIAMRFRKRLMEQGHDGIVYGNEYETDRSKPGSNLGAIVFNPSRDIHVTQYHPAGQPCHSEEEGERNWRRQPSRGQQELPFREGAVFTPTERIFGPTHCLDHRLFENGKMRPAVRAVVLERISPVLASVLGPSWKEFTRVYLAGSEASLWTNENCEGNGDFDTLVGIDHDHAVAAGAHPASGEIEPRLNVAFSERYNEEGWHPPFDPQGSWSLTGYANPGSYDIRKINPYAAYDITNDRWAVRPPELPDWGPDKFPQGPALFQQGRALIAEVRAILRLPEPFRTQEARRIWDYIHKGRKHDFTEEGLGWLGTGNALEKMLDQASGHLVDKLKKLVYEEHDALPMALGQGMSSRDVEVPVG